MAVGARDRNFEDFAPHLEEVVHLVRDKAQLLGQARNLAPYDALVDEFSPGLTSGEIDAMFKALARRLPGLIREVLARQEQRPVLPIVGKFSAGKQRALAVEIMKAVGFPFDRGRLDESEHPFTEGVPGDVRVTTRFDTTEPFSGLLGALHETGHAMYDVGLPPEYADQPVGRDRGMALEESQSLLMEMIVCRSRGFVDLPEAAAGETFRRVRPGVVGRKSLRAPDAREARTDPRRRRRAHLHAAHPAALRARKPAAVGRPRRAQPARCLEFHHGTAAGREAPNDLQGVLQDVHWAVGSFGYFPSYALGAVMAAQFYEALREAVPDVDTQIARGEFAGLMGWLRENVHAKARASRTQELLKHSTGKPLSAAAALRYLEAKYLEP